MNVYVKAHNIVATVLSIIGKYGQYTEEPQGEIFILIKGNLDYFSSDPHKWFYDTAGPTDEPIYFDDLKDEDQEKVLSLLEVLEESSSEQEFIEWCMWCTQLSSEFDAKILKHLFNGSDESEFDEIL